MGREPASSSVAPGSRASPRPAAARLTWLPEVGLHGSVMLQQVRGCGGRRCRARSPEWEPSEPDVLGPAPRRPAGGSPGLLGAGGGIASGCGSADAELGLPRGAAPTGPWGCLAPLLRSHGDAAGPACLSALLFADLRGHVCTLRVQQYSYVQLSLDLQLFIHCLWAFAFLLLRLFRPLVPNLQLDPESENWAFSRQLVAL